MEKQQKVMIYSWLLLAVVFLSMSVHARPVQNLLSITSSSVDERRTPGIPYQVLEKDFRTDEIDAIDSGNLRSIAPMNLSGNVVTPVNLSGDSTGMLWEEILRKLQNSASDHDPTNMSRNIANPLNLSGDSRGTLEEEILQSLQNLTLTPMDLSGNSVNPLNLSGDSIGTLQAPGSRILSGSVVNPMNLSGNSIGPMREEILRSLQNSAPGPMDVSGDVVNP